jgi:hypothetical protein
MMLLLSFLKGQEGKMPDISIGVLRNTLPYAITLGIAVLTQWLNAQFNTAIKFAPDAAHAKREIRQIVLNLIGWAAQGIVALQLIWQILYGRSRTLAYLCYSSCCRLSLCSARICIVWSYE